MATNEAHVIDVTNLHQPQLQGSYHPELAIDAFVVTDTTAYLATYQGLEVVDIRHPTRPTQLTQVPWEHAINRMIQQPTGLAVGYRATYPAGGVLLVDLSNPRMPQLGGDVPLPGQVQDLVGTDRYLYTLTWHPTKRSQHMGGLRHVRCVGAHDNP
ncbi:MAG: hypothetical protein HC828_01810 [Blastochloris sp.]|nr:hypothetical protein [Blastochloris sp.]